MVITNVWWEEQTFKWSHGVYASIYFLMRSPNDTKEIWTVPSESKFCVIVGHDPLLNNTMCLFFPCLLSASYKHITPHKSIFVDCVNLLKLKGKRYQGPKICVVHAGHNIITIMNLLKSLLASCSMLHFCQQVKVCCPIKNPNYNFPYEASNH